MQAACFDQSLSRCCLFGKLRPQCTSEGQDVSVIMKEGRNAHCQIHSRFDSDHLADHSPDRLEDARLQSVRHRDRLCSRRSTVLQASSAHFCGNRYSGRCVQCAVADHPGHYSRAVRLRADSGNRCYGSDQSHAQQCVPRQENPRPYHRLGLRLLHGRHGRIRNRCRDPRIDPGHSGF